MTYVHIYIAWLLCERVHNKVPRRLEKMARMTGQLGMQVTNHKKRETGDVVVRYKTFDQLELIYRRLRGD